MSAVNMNMVGRILDKMRESEDRNLHMPLNGRYNRKISADCSDMINGPCGSWSSSFSG